MTSCIEDRLVEQGQKKGAMDREHVRIKIKMALFLYLPYSTETSKYRRWVFLSPRDQGFGSRQQVVSSVVYILPTWRPSDPTMGGLHPCDCPGPIPGACHRPRLFYLSF